MDPANPEEDLEEAAGVLTLIANGLPVSGEGGDALRALAQCRRRQGLTAASAAAEARLVVDAPDRAPARSARLRLAEAAARLGEEALARRLLASLVERDLEKSFPEKAAQGDRDSSERRLIYPISRETAEPIDREDARAGRALAALIDRAAGDGEKPPRARVFDVVSPGGTELRSLTTVVAAETGEVWLLDARARRAVPIAETGNDAAVAPIGLPEDVKGILPLPGGRICSWTDRTIFLADGRRFDPSGPAEAGEAAPPVRRIGGVSFGPDGEIDVLDTGGRRVLRYGRNLSLRGEIARFEDRPTAMVRGGGVLYVLLRSKQQVVALTLGSGSGRGVPGERRAGAAQQVIDLKGAGWEIDSPDAIAADALGRLYVLDGSARSVSIFGRSGIRVAVVAPEKGSLGTMRSPEGIAVDAEGRLYVADTGSGRVLRYR